MALWPKTERSRESRPVHLQVSAPSTSRSPEHGKDPHSVFGRVLLFYDQSGRCRICTWLVGFTKACIPAKTPEDIGRVKELVLGQSSSLAHATLNAEYPAKPELIVV